MVQPGTTTYQYFTNDISDGMNYGNLKLFISDSGAWNRYEYNTNGLLTNEVSGF